MVNDVTAVAVIPYGIPPSLAVMIVTVDVRRRIAFLKPSRSRSMLSSFRVGSTCCHSTWALTAPLCGSIIQAENSSLGESVSLVGTPFSLNYQSSRSKGASQSNTMRVQLTQNTIPPSLKTVTLQVSVAGNIFNQSFMTSQIIYQKYIDRDSFSITLIFFLLFLANI